MKDVQRLKEMVLEKVELDDLMLSYGVEFIYDPRAMQEVQFKCPFHGKDNKPSARFYRETKSCWCWVCHQKWDVISFAKDKEGLSYLGAILFLVDRYALDTSMIPDTPRLDPVELGGVDGEEVLLTSVRSRLQDKKGIIPFEKFNALASAFYMICFAKFRGDKVMEPIKKLEIKMQRI